MTVVLDVDLTMAVERRGSVLEQTWCLLLRTKMALSLRKSWFFLFHGVETESEFGVQGDSK